MDLHHRSLILLLDIYNNNHKRAVRKVRESVQDMSGATVSSTCSECLKYVNSLFHVQSILEPLNAMRDVYSMSWGNCKYTKIKGMFGKRNIDERWRFCLGSQHMLMCLKSISPEVVTIIELATNIRCKDGKWESYKRVCGEMLNKFSTSNSAIIFEEGEDTDLYYRLNLGPGEIFKVERRSYKIKTIISSKTNFSVQKLHEEKKSVSKSLDAALLKPWSLRAKYAKSVVKTLGYNETTSLELSSGGEITATLDSTYTNNTNQFYRKICDNLSTMCLLLAANRSKEVAMKITSNSVGTCVWNVNPEGRTIILSNPPLLGDMSFAINHVVGWSGSGCYVEGYRPENQGGGVYHWTKVQGEGTKAIAKDMYMMTGNLQGRKAETNVADGGIQRGVAEIREEFVRPDAQEAGTVSESENSKRKKQAFRERRL